MSKVFLFTKIGDDKSGTFYARDAGAIRRIVYSYPENALKICVESEESGDWFNDDAAVTILQWANEHSYDVFAQMAKRESVAVSFEVAAL